MLTLTADKNEAAVNASGAMAMVIIGLFLVCIHKAD
jgi:hypothetical protein